MKRTAHCYFHLKVHSYQQQVIEEKDLSLKLGQFLFMGFVCIRHLKQTTAAHQTSVGHSEDLQKAGQTDEDDSSYHAEDKLKQDDVSHRRKEERKSKQVWDEKKSISHRHAVTHRFQAQDGLLHPTHIGDMVFIGAQLSLLDPLIDSCNHLSGDVCSVVHTCEGSRRGPCRKTNLQILGITIYHESGLIKNLNMFSFFIESK